MNHVAKAEDRDSLYGLISLLCVQNAIRMGARTQLFLCPVKQRSRLQNTLRERSTRKLRQPINMTSRIMSEGNVELEKFVGIDVLEEYEVQEEEYLLRTNILDDDSDEEHSSGDEDELFDVEALFSEEPVNLDEEFYEREQLFVPFTTENDSGGQATRLPFNWRKLPYFDTVTADERRTVRKYLIREIRRLKRDQAIKKTKLLQSAAQNSASDAAVHHKHQHSTESCLAAIQPFPGPMTPAMAAAMIAESLSLNPYESAEGMAACYEGIIAAGVAVLDGPDPTQPSRTRASRSEIMRNLTLLLITNLAHPSGELILSLAKLRRMCSTPRYRRRFVQRIAPALIRPPGAAMWCLRHQNDMEAILAAAELIFDAAFDVFGTGWYEQGRWILADSQRAKTLKSAADQLKNLSNEPADGLAFSHQRRPRTKKDDTKEPLAEWQVIAVDNQIKLSISSVLTADWTKTVVPEAIPRPVRMRTVSNASRGRNARSSRPSTPRIDEREHSPPPPAPPARTTDQTSPTQSHSTTSLPPPRSPRSPHKGTSGNVNHLAREHIGTPLSPSSVGTTASVDTSMVTYRPTTMTSPSAQYRMLTSTTAERKRTVAACRALRAQISRFEDAFIQLHGRPPKGAADRAPLATTYAQYREWKRAIRADAACRIQALFRGSLCRLKLLRSGHTDVIKVITRRAGRSGSGGTPYPIIPAEMGDVPALAPAEVWRQNATPTLQTAPSTASEDDELDQLSFAELQARKRDLKQQLKQYDIEFVRKHSRMPLKPEKEPIRHLYESYNRLKAKISRMEKNGTRQNQIPVPAAKLNTAVRQRSVSPLSLSDNDDPAKPVARSNPPPSGRPERRQLPVSPQSVGVVVAQDLAALRAEKQNLHSMLRAYEREFFRENRRQVSSFDDIRPVASQYRRYKEIKKSIAAIQQQQGGTN